MDEVGGYIDAELNERLLGILSTKENVNLETLGFGDESKKYRAIITPIDIAGERLGTLFEYRCETEYDIDDIILTEYGTTVVGLEMMRSVNEESAEEARKVAIVKSRNLRQSPTSLMNWMAMREFLLQAELRIAWELPVP